MLLYKDMNIEHKNDTQKLGNDKRIKKHFSRLSLNGPGPRTMPGLKQLPILPNG